MVLGAHVSTSGGIHNAIKNGDKLQCDAIQIFVAKPKSLGIKTTYLVEVMEKFCEAWIASPIQDVIVHDIHLSNLASPKQDVLEKSRKQFKQTDGTFTKGWHIKLYRYASWRTSR